jgi:hypothetical protein
MARNVTCTKETCFELENRSVELQIGTEGGLIYDFLLLEEAV